MKLISVVTVSLSSELQANNSLNFSSHIFFKKNLFNFSTGETMASKRHSYKRNNTLLIPGQNRELMSSSRIFNDLARFCGSKISNSAYIDVYLLKFYSNY